MNSDNKYIATLESRIDHLETELTQLDLLLKKVGFPEGIATLKETAEELLQEAEIFNQFEESEA
ncbi:MAG TPA: hypothetical protein DCE71_01205 [Parachlamydiales bacterium]|nr:hypothetical protein [Parachlamydiales bacterium]